MSRGERYELDLSGTPPTRTLAASHGRQAPARQAAHSREASRGSCCAACVASGGYWTAGHGRRGEGAPRFCAPLLWPLAARPVGGCCSREPTRELAASREARGRAGAPSRTWAAALRRRSS